MTMKILTVYYSRSGNTRKVAEAISKAIISDLEDITEPRGRGGPIGWLRSGREATGEMTTSINQSKSDPASYDLLIVGTPIWGGKLSSPVRAYLTQVAGKTKRIAYFVTMMGNEDSVTYAAMEKIAGRPLATLSVSQTELKNSTYLNKVNKFVEILRKHLDTDTPMHVKKEQ
jgi:flavodoxin